MENIYHVTIANQPLYLADTQGQIWKEMHEADKFIREWTAKGYFLIGSWTVNYTPDAKTADSRIHVLMGLPK